MKKILLYSTVFLVLFSCSDNSKADDFARDFTGIYSGVVNRSNDYPPFRFEATIVNNTILKFRCSGSSGYVCFNPVTNTEINNDGTFIMSNISDNRTERYTGSINSDFKFSGTYFYELDGTSITTSFLGYRQ